MYQYSVVRKNSVFLSPLPGRAHFLHSKQLTGKTWTTWFWIRLLNHTKKVKAFKQSMCITVMAANYFSNGFLRFSVVFLIINWIEIGYSFFFFNFDNKITGNAHVLYPYLSRRQSYIAAILLQCWRCPLRWDAHFYVTKSLTRRVKQDIAGQRVERIDSMYGDEHMYNACSLLQCPSFSSSYIYG